MNLSILHSGSTYDLTNAVTDISLTSAWQNGADKLTFTFINDNKEISNGDYVTFKYEHDLFSGIVFTIQHKKNNIVSVTCYDQRRYLKAKDTVLRTNTTLTKFIETCAGDLQLAVGDLTDTVVNLNKYLYDSETYLDMIYGSINDNLLLNGYYYVLRCDGGKLTLKELTELRLPLLIGDGSIAYDFELKESIDSEVYNKVKLAKDNESTGLRDIYVVQDSSHFEDWGVLQYFEKITSDLNESQIKERAELLLKVKNHEKRTLKINAIGNDQIMGGNSIRVKISDLGIDTWAIVDKVTHNFGSNYTMTLDLVFEEE